MAYFEEELWYNVFKSWDGRDHCGEGMHVFLTYGTVIDAKADCDKIAQEEGRYAWAERGMDPAYGDGRDVELLSVGKIIASAIPERSE